MRSFFYLYLSFLFFWSCAKKKEEMIIEDHVKKNSVGDIHFLLGSVYKIDGIYHDFEMFPDGGFLPSFKRYVTASGDSIVLSDLSYFVHHVVLFNSKGDSLHLKDSVFVVHYTPSHRDDNFMLRGIPEGTYVAISFYIGALDLGSRALGTLKQKAPKFISGAEDQLFFQFKGLYKNTDTSLAHPKQPAKAWKKIDWRFTSPKTSIFKQKVVCPFFVPIEVDAKKQVPYLHIRVDMRALFGIENEVKSQVIALRDYPVTLFEQESAIPYKNLFVNNPQGANLMFVNDHVHPN